MYATVPRNNIKPKQKAKAVGIRKGPHLVKGSAVGMPRSTLCILLRSSTLGGLP